MKIVDCKNCGKETNKSVNRYNESIKKGWNFFCSKVCRYNFQEKGKEFSCAQCSKIIVKTPAQIRQTKTNVFCSKSCAAQFNNRHKKTGTRRSKLEIYLEQKIKSRFSELKLFCNSKKPIGLELDFYFPDLKLAVEINGFLHYKAIFGLEKLNRIQELDRDKALKCKSKGIYLFIIDVSNEPHLTQTIKLKHWKTLKKLITQCGNFADKSNGLK